MISVSFPNKTTTKKINNNTEKPENQDRNPIAAEKRHLEHTLSRTKKNLKHFSFDHYNCYAISHFAPSAPSREMAHEMRNAAAEQPIIKSIVQRQTIQQEIANDYLLKSFQSHIISRLSDTWHQRNYFNNLRISIISIHLSSQVKKGIFLFKS